MYEIYFNFSIFNLFVVPFYLLIILSFIVIHLSKKSLNISKDLKINFLNYNIYSYKSYFIIIIPILLILFFNYYLFR